MQLNRPNVCIAQFNLYLVVIVVAILPITRPLRPAIASHNLARFNPGINPGIKQTQSRNPGIGKTVRDCIPNLQSPIRREKRRGAWRAPPTCKRPSAHLQYETCTSGAYPWFRSMVLEEVFTQSHTAVCPLQAFVFPTLPIRNLYPPGAPP